MNHFRPLLAVVAGLVLAGCTAIPATDLPALGKAATLTSAQSPEDAYRNVVRGARACFNRFFEVTADYFPNRQEGTVTVAMKSALSMSAAVLVEVRSTPQGSAVDVTSHPSATAMTETVQNWLNGTYTVCDIAK